MSTSTSRRPPFGVILADLARDTSLPHAAFRLYAVLTTYVDTEGRAFPSNARLAADLGITERSVQRFMEVLVERGIVRRVARRGVWDTYLADVTQGRRSTSGDDVERPPRDDTERQVRGDAESHPEQDQRTDQVNRTPLTSPLDGTDTPHPFDEFWQMYPRKVGKQRARTAFRRAVERHSLEQVMEGLSAWRGRLSRMMEEGDGRFVPHAATWLNDDRYLTRPEPRLR